MYHPVSVFINIAVLGIGAFVLLFLFTRPRKNKSLLIPIILVVGIFLYELLINSLYQTQLIYQLPWLFKLEWIFDLAIYPLLLLLVFRLVNFNPFPFWVWLFFFLPFGFEFFWYTSRYLWVDAELKTEMINAFYEFNRKRPIDLFSNPIVFIKRLLIPVSFLLASLLILIPNRQKLTKQGIYPPLIVLLSLCILFKASASFLYKTYYSFTSDLLSEKILNSGFLTLIVLLCCSYLANEIVKANSFLQQNTPRNQQGNIKKPQQQILWQLLLTHLQEKESYLDSNLTLQGLALQLSTNTTYLSQTINELAEKNFTDFINAYRIKNAQKLLKDPDFDQYTIDGIAAKTGFVSKSAFYRAFKKETGLTPGQYKKA